MKALVKYLPYFLIPISIVLYEVTTVVVMLIYPLSSIVVSSTDPQNSFIAMFWYDGIGNILSFLASSLLIVPMLMYLGIQQKYVRVLFVIIGSFIVSYYAIFYWATTLANSYESGFGQSGVAYAMFGLVLGMYFSDFILLLAKRRFYNIIVVLMVIIPLVLLVYVLPTITFSEAPNVLFVIHRMSFEYGVISGFLFSIVEGSFSLVFGGSLYEMGTIG